MKPSEYLKQHPKQAYGIEALAVVSGWNVVQVITELVEAQTEGRTRGGFPIEVVSGMWQWRVKS